MYGDGLSERNFLYILNGSVVKSTANLWEYHLDNVPGMNPFFRFFHDFSELRRGEIRLDLQGSCLFTLLAGFTFTTSGLFNLRTSVLDAGNRLLIFL